MPAQRVAHWVGPVTKVQLRSAPILWLWWSVSTAQIPRIEHLTRRRI
jgi:hypothetical protein